MYAQLPQIYIASSDRKRLFKLARDAYVHHERTAPFLSAELRRAEYCTSSAFPRTVVKVGDRVRYQMDWGPVSASCALVYPEDYTGEPGQISLLSPIGVGLLGLAAGARMPVFIPNEGFHILGLVDIS